MQKSHFIKLGGTPRERGQQRGEEHKALVWEHMERLKFAALGSGDPDILIDNFVQETNHVGVAQKWTPHLLDEVRGISDASGLPFNQVFALSCLDEIWRYSEAREGKQTMGCTALGCSRTEDTPTLLGQNLDTSILVKNLLVMMHIVEDDRQVLMVTYPGSLGIIGINNAPLGVCVNTIHLKYSPEGLPLQFRLRAILEKPSLVEAVEFLKTVRHGAAQNFALGDAEQVVDYECSASGAVQFVPYEGARRVYHANHHLASEDIIPDYPTISPSSLNRMAYLEYRLAEESKPVGLDNIKSILRSHQGPLCYHGSHDASATTTAFSVAYELSPQDPALHLAVGNPCESVYDVYRFDG